MTTRNLDALFEPRSIALIGASNRPQSVGAVLARNLLESGFAGPVMPVNPRERAIRSTLAYNSLSELPVAPDLAVIATPAASVPGLVGELGERGCRAAVVISAGFGAVEGGLRAPLLQAARPHLLRVLGPNCLGFISPRQGINASFSHLTPKAGGLAMVAQSGAVAAAALDWAVARGVGFSHIVTIGDAADIDVGDLLDYLALDSQTKAILLYVESITDARKLMTAGRIASRTKPVVVIKAGRSAAGAKAAFSHTGALAGSDAVYDAAFRRAGMLRVGELRELFDAVTTLTAGLRVAGDRLAVVTNGGGAGVMAADMLELQGGRLASLSEAARERLKAALPATATPANPVDIIGDAPPERYAAALEAVLQEPEADALLVMNCPTAVADSTAAAETVIRTYRAAPRRMPMFTCWLGETAAAEGRRRFSAAGVPTHETPDEAVRAFMHLVNYRRNQQLLVQTPAKAEGRQDASAARALVEAALAAGRTHLTDPEAREMLAAYGVPVAASRVAADPATAGQAAEAMAAPVALKILSADISHKSDVGGVMLNLRGRAQVEAEAKAMLERVGAALPAARIDGFIVQQMIERPHAEELIAGLLQDAVFGPVVLFGRGGVAVEVEGDRTLGLTPLNDVLAHDMIARTRIARRLAGYRDRPPADLAAISEVLVKLSCLAGDLPEVAELDINPLLADADGVIALDARIRIAPADQAVRPAIRPYPAELSRQARLGDAVLFLRPIRPQDADALREMIDRSEPEDVRLRFRSGLRRLPEHLTQRLTQIDYDREMALVAEHEGAIVGVARLVGDPEGVTAEFALMVRSDWQHRGLGRLLLEAVVDYGQRRGLQEVWGDVAYDNHRMIDLAMDLGFRREGCPEDFARVKMRKVFADRSGGEGAARASLAKPAPAAGDVPAV